MIAKMNMNSTSSQQENCRLDTVDALKRVDPLLAFNRVVVKHPRIESVLQELLFLAEPNTGTDIALLIGPTGVGKTSLTLALQKRILTERYDAMVEDPSFVPVVLMEAPASGEISFSWRMFYIKLGAALFEPEMDKKVETVLKEGRTTIKKFNAGTTVASMRAAVENALKFRRTLLVVIDEAVHMFRNCNPMRCAMHMDALKSLSNISGVTLALVGSYDLHTLASLSGQLARRTAIIHMQRYVPGDKTDEMYFQTVIKTL